MSRIPFSITGNLEVDQNYNQEPTIFVSAYDTGTVGAYSTNGINWKQMTIPNRYWLSSTYGNGIFFMVGWAYTENRTGARSTDGITWTALTVPLTNQIQDTVYGNGIFVTIPWGGTSVATSPDAETWTQGDSGVSADWKSIEYGNGVFVATSTTNVSMYSTDGTVWAQTTMPLNNSWRTTRYGNGFFVSVSQGNGLAKSTNGITWTLTSSPSSNFNDIIYGNGLFVGVSDQYAKASTDLINWTSTYLPLNMFYTIGYGEGIFTLFRERTSTFAYSTDGVSWTLTSAELSPIALNAGWMRPSHGKIKFSNNNLVYNNHSVSSNIQTTGQYSYQTSDVFVHLINNTTNAFYSTDLITWTSTTASKQNWTSIAYGNEKFVALVNSGQGIASNTNIYGYSTNGVIWNTSTLPVSRVWTEICYGKGMFVAVSALNDAIGSDAAVYSYDAITWYTSTLPLVTNWQAMAYGNGKFVTVDINTTNAAISTDAVTWSISTLPIAKSWVAVAYGNDKFVVTAGSSSFVISSTDGIAWTQSYMPSPAGTQSTRNWDTLIFGNGIFVAASNNYSNAAYSYNGINWYVSQLPSAVFWNDIGYGNGIFLLAATNTTGAYSTNGITWTLQTMPSTGSFGRSFSYGKFINKVNTLSNANLDSNNITFTSNIQKQLDSKVNEKSTITYLDLVSADLQENIFITFTADGLKTCVVSTDGINWTTVSSISGSSGNGIYAFGKYIGFSYAYGEVYVSTDLVTWNYYGVPATNTRKAAYGNGLVIALQDSRTTTTAISSTDGINWNAVTMPTSAAWRDVAYGNGIFAAVAFGPTTTAASSTDGISWTTRTMPASVTWTALTFGNGTFVAINGVAEGGSGGSGGTRAATSTNGTTWTVRTLPSSTSWCSITYGGGLFVIVSNPGFTMGQTASSTNGITWSLGDDMPFPVRPNFVGYSNGIFVAGGYNGGYQSLATAFAYSNNGINWNITYGPESYSQGMISMPLKNNINSKSIQGEIVIPLSSSTYTVKQYDKYVSFGAAATCTITLPNAGEYPNREITIKNTTAFAVNSDSANVKPLATNTAGTAILAATAGKYATIISDGYHWVVREAN